jgi:hypothetical protein
MVIHAHISPVGWTVGPLVAAILRRKSQTIDVINTNAYFPKISYYEISGTWTERCTYGLDWTCSTQGKLNAKFCL